MKRKPTVSSLKRNAPTRSKLQTLRDNAHLGLREAAKAIGISPATLCRVECGRNPDIISALKLAHFYETTVEELFGEAGAKERP